LVWSIVLQALDFEDVVSILEYAVLRRRG